MLYLSGYRQAAILRKRWRCKNATRMSISSAFSLCAASCPPGDTFLLVMRHLICKCRRRRHHQCHCRCHQFDAVNSCHRLEQWYRAEVTSGEVRPTTYLEFRFTRRRVRRHLIYKFPFRGSKRRLVALTCYRWVTFHCVITLVQIRFEILDEKQQSKERTRDDSEETFFN